MTINTNQQLTLKNKINKQAEQKQTHRFREHFDCCQMEGRLEGWVKKVRGLRSTNWLLQNSHGDINYRIENTVNNLIIICEVR